MITKDWYDNTPKGLLRIAMRKRRKWVITRIIVITVFVFLLLGTSSKQYKRLLPIVPYYKGVENKDIPSRCIIPDEYMLLFAITSKKEGVPIEVLSNIARVESKFNPKAVSPERASGSRDLGMFQINSNYLLWFGKRYVGQYIDPMKPDEAILVASRHLKYLYNTYGDWRIAVRLYNSGESSTKINERYLKLVYKGAL